MVYSLGVVSGCQSNPSRAHWKMVFLKYYRPMAIYGEPDLKPVEFTNSSFESDRDDYTSVSGYVFIHKGGVVCWKCSEQNTVAN